MITNAPTPINVHINVFEGPMDLLLHLISKHKVSINDVLNYTILFENDPEFATAAAHKIVVADTLDVTKFDLSSFAPTRVKIGEKSAELNGDKNFVTTIDMRPEIR